MAHAVALNVGAVRVAGAGVDVAAAGAAPPPGAGVGVAPNKLSKAELGETAPRGIAEAHCV